MKKKEIFEIDEKNGIILVHQTGEMAYEKNLNLIEECLKLKDQYNIKKFLLDQRGTTEVDKPVDQIEFLSKFEEMGITRVIDTAALVVDEITQNHHFIETLGRNKGYSMKFFTDMKQAKKWLKEQ